MATPDPRVKSVRLALAEMKAICDLGFALAVHIRLIRPTLLYQTYPLPWVEHYSMKGYMLTDPTVRWGLEHAGSIRWCELADQDAAGVFADARRFGLAQGITHAAGLPSSRTIASGSKSGADFTQAEIDRLAAAVEAIHAATDGYDDFPEATQQALRELGHMG